MGVVGVHAGGIDRALARVPEHRAFALATHDMIKALGPLILTIARHGKRGVSELFFGKRQDDVCCAFLLEQFIDKNEIATIGCR